MSESTPLRLDNDRFSRLRTRLQAARRDKPTAEELERHRGFSRRVNVVYETLSSRQGDVPVESGMAYRFVRLAAIDDLAEVGIVRNEATAKNNPYAKDGHRVYWSAKLPNSVDPVYFQRVAPGDALLVSPREIVDAGWVTIRDIQHIYVKTPNGQAVDLLGEEGF